MFCSVVFCIFLLRQHTGPNLNTPPWGFPHRDDLLYAITPAVMDVIGKSVVTNPGGQIPQAKVLLFPADPHAEVQVKTQP